MKTLVLQGDNLPGDNLPGDNFVSNILINVLILAILLRLWRLQIFKWCITILGVLFVITRTAQRIALLGGRGEWIHINYFQRNLVSWIACVIVDGTLALYIWREYRGRRQQMLRDFIGNWTLVEEIGLGLSLVSMANLGCDVYKNFHGLTHYMLLFIVFVCMMSRIVIRGMCTIAPCLITRAGLHMHNRPRL